MAEKIRKPVLGAIFTVSTIIMIVFFAFVWGRVILIKNVDTNRVNTMISNLELLDRAIRSCSETRQTQTVEMDLNSIQFLVRDDLFLGDSVVSLNTVTLTPVLSFVTWVPMNAKALPYTVDRHIQYLQPSPTYISCFSGMTGPAKTNTIRMYEKDYTFHALITDKEECPVLVCLKNDLNTLDCSKNCGCESDIITDGNESYMITFANEFAVEFGGRIRERVGLTGKDIQGIIVGRAERFGNENSNSMVLVYRTMSEGARNRKIILTCPGECVTSGGMKTVRVSYASILTEGDTDYHNIILSIGG